MNPHTALSARAPIPGASPLFARTKLFALAFLATMATMGLAACDADPSTSVTPGFDQSELRLTPNDVQMDNHSRTTLELRRIFSDGRTVPASGSVTWSSSSPAVATVSSSGEVSARLPGEVTITASTNRGSASARIQILPTNQDLRLVVEDSLRVVAGPEGSKLLTARIVDVTGRPVPGLQVDFGIIEGQGAIEPARSFTDASGYARATLTPGVVAGELQAEATSPGIVRGGAAAAAAEGDATAPFWNTLRRFFRVIVAPSYPATLSITPGTVSVDAGKSASLSAEVRDAYGNIITNPSLQWASSDAQRAPVSESGEVMGMSATSAEITATASDDAGRSASGTAQVEVLAGQASPALAGIELAGGNNQSGTVGQNLPSALAVRALDAQGNVLGGIPIQWEVTQGSATLGNSTSTTASTGMATTTVRLGTQAGQVRVRATAPGVSALTFQLVANPGAPASVEVSPAAATVAAGETLNLSAAVRDQHGNSISNATLAWSSSSTETATVNSSGRVTARATGAAEIRAQVGSATGTSAITVPASTPNPPTTSEPGQVSDLQVISATSSSVTLRFTEVNDGTGNPALYNIRFRDSGTFGNWGTAQAVSQGSCSATMGSPLVGEAVGTVRTCIVTGLTAGSEYSFRMVAFRRDGTENIFGALSNIGAGGTISGDGSGSGGGGDGGNGGDPVATTLRITAPTTSLTSLGQALQLGVEAQDASGSTVGAPSVTWTSSNTSVASVNSSGRVIANAVGTAIISVAAACCSSDQVTIEVSQQVASVEVSPGSASLVPGQTQQFLATARDANGHPISGISINWSSTNPSVANVSASGLVGAIVAGSAQVRASASGHVGSGGVSVSSPSGGSGSGPSTSSWPNEPSGLSALAHNDWNSLPGSWGINRWGTTVGNHERFSRIAQDPSSPGSGNVLEGVYLANAANGSGAGRTGWRFGNGPSEMFVGMWKKVDADFVNHPVQLKWSFAIPVEGDAQMWIDWRERSGTHAESSNLRLRFQGAAWQRSELVEQNVQGSLVRFPKGEWVQVELYLRAESYPGARDGIARLWQNGTLIVEVMDLVVPGGAFMQFYHEGVYGGGGSPVPQDQSWYVAETYISGR